jgi:hypothetical protein
MLSGVAMRISSRNECVKASDCWSDFRPLSVFFGETHEFHTYTNISESHYNTHSSCSTDNSSSYYLINLFTCQLLNIYYMATLLTVPVLALFEANFRAVLFGVSSFIREFMWLAFSEKCSFDNSKTITLLIHKLRSRNSPSSGFVVKADLSRPNRKGGWKGASWLTQPTGAGQSLLQNELNQAECFQAPEAGMCGLFKGGTMSCIVWCFRT